MLPDMAVSLLPSHPHQMGSSLPPPSTINERYTLHLPREYDVKFPTVAQVGLRGPQSSIIMHQSTSLCPPPTIYYNASSLEDRFPPQTTPVRLHSLMSPPPCPLDPLLLPPLLCRSAIPFKITCGETAIGMASLGCGRDALCETRG